MRRGVRLLMTVATAAVLAVAFRAGTAPRTTPAGQISMVGPGSPGEASARRSRPARRDGRRSTPSTAASPRPTATTPRPARPTSPVASRPATSVVAAGGVVDTQYGPVQVEITVRSGRIVKAHTLQHPSGDGQTDRINGYAVPQLDQEAMSAQSAQIDTVSGATFTSEGYKQSLQSALDAAHRAGVR